MKEKFAEYLRAGYPLIWVQTHEECRAIQSLATEAQGYKIFSWDIVAGMRDHFSQKTNPMNDPIKAITSTLMMNDDSVLFVKDAHKFVESLEMFRTLKNILPQLKAKGKHIVFVSPLIKIPVELEKDIILFPFSLPTTDEIVRVAKKIISENNLTIDVDEKIISTAKGLTLTEAENAIALSIVKEKKIDKKVLQKEKLQAIRKSGILEIFEPVKENELGGL